MLWFEELGPIDLSAREGLPAQREQLVLEIPEKRDFRLVRTVTSRDPGRPAEAQLTASLTASGRDLEVLL